MESGHLGDGGYECRLVPTNANFMHNGVSTLDYFSDRENGPRPRVEECISPSAWGGIVAIVQALVSSGAFGIKYPDVCPDGAGTVGTDEKSLSLVLRAEIPELEWPLKTTTEPHENFSYHQEPYAPTTLTILDFIEFCFRSVGKPVQNDFHKFFLHHHLLFDEQVGRDEFRISVNRIFSRNAIAYNLSETGHIERLAPSVLREVLSNTLFASGDGTLDRMFEDARQKYLSPDLRIRQEALERLWDGWERLKSQAYPTNKRVAVATLLDRAAPDAPFRAVLEKEALELTDIGNSFHIRHSEVSQTPLTSSAHIDYLFHRLFCLILLLLRR